MGFKTQYIHKEQTGNNETDIQVVAGVGLVWNILVPGGEITSRLYRNRRGRGDC
jgi:hypothetical protein